MKHLKTLGLAVVAAMALLAFVGAGSASATVLCKTAVNPCPAEWKYPIGTLLDTSLTAGTSTIWEGAGLPQTCSESTFKGTTENNGSSTETVLMRLEAFNINNCTLNWTLVSPGELEIHSIEGTNNGTLTVRGLVWQVGPFCRVGFSNWTDIGTITGGNPANVVINVTVPWVGGCFETYHWTASYAVTQPTPLYVESS